MMSASEDFTPKIVKWGRRNGAKNQKYGLFIQAQQWSGGKTSNNRTVDRRGGKTYKNAKLDKASRRHQYMNTAKKGAKNLRG